MSRNGKTYPPAPMIATFVNVTLAFDANDHQIESRVLPDSPTQLEKEETGSRPLCDIFEHRNECARTARRGGRDTVSANAEAGLRLPTALRQAVRRGRQEEVKEVHLCHHRSASRDEIS